MCITSVLLHTVSFHPVGQGREVGVVGAPGRFASLLNIRIRRLEMFGILVGNFFVRVDEIYGDFGGGFPRLSHRPQINIES